MKDRGRFHAQKVNIAQTASTQILDSLYTRVASTLQGNLVIITKDYSENIYFRNIQVQIQNVSQISDWFFSSDKRQVFGIAQNYYLTLSFRKRFIE